MSAIDADSLIRQIKLQANRTSSGEMSDPYMTWQDVVRLILEAPTITYADLVPHGRWKYYHKHNKAVCTECSFERDLEADFGRAVSCPNCGARMDGGKDNGK